MNSLLQRNFFEAVGGLMFTVSCEPEENLQVLQTANGKPPTVNLFPFA